MNHSKHYRAGQSRGEMITRKASKTAIVRCKGIDGLSLGELWKEADDGVLCRQRVSRVASTD